jgi:hypothetical protein
MRFGQSAYLVTDARSGFPMHSLNESNVAQSHVNRQFETPVRSVIVLSIRHEVVYQNRS